MTLIKRCRICGKALKPFKKHDLCYECDCTREFTRKGPHAPSGKQVKALKKIGRKGMGWWESNFLTH